MVCARDSFKSSYTELVCIPCRLHETQPPYLHSVEPPGAEIRMFRFMRDVEPEDPMFLM